MQTSLVVYECATNHLFQSEFSDIERKDRDTVISFGQYKPEVELWLFGGYTGSHSMSFRFFTVHLFVRPVAYRRIMQDHIIKATGVKSNCSFDVLA